MVFYLWTTVISLSALALLFLSEGTVFALAALVAIPVLVYTVWPVIERRRKRANSK
jgi:Sec-independent protein secretion pathway component TatC